MAGVKGRSGGPRPNSGGARPGAGRKPKPPPILALAATYDDPEKFLRAVMNDSGTDAKLRVDAAKALMPYVHPKKAEASKKPEPPKPSGRFAPKAPPKLVVSNR
jgi:phage terminase small subunit